MQKPVLQFNCPMQWEKMEGTSTVKSCSACKKQIHDLTPLSPAELVVKYKESNGELCGRVSVSQLAITPALLTAGLTALTGISVAQPSTQDITVTPVRHETQALQTEFHLYGAVIDHTFESVPFAMVNVHCNGNLVARTMTDENGVYKLIIARNKLTNTILNIEFNSPGYAVKNDTLHITDWPESSHNVILQEATITLDEVVISDDNGFRGTLVGVLAYPHYVCGNIAHEETFYDSVPEVKDTNQLILFPNPANEITHLQLVNESNYIIEIYTTDGKQVRGEIFTGNRFTLPVAELPVGNYLIRVEDRKTGKFITDKLVVIR